VPVRSRAGPELGPEFGRDFQSTYVNAWLSWVRVGDISEVRYHTTLTGDLPAARLSAHAAARDLAKTF
jgi:FMN-dependent NADH-azoreductase